MKLFKRFDGTFAGADKESVEQQDKVKVGEVINVTLDSVTKQNRSSKQNRYYWGVVIATLHGSLENGIDRDGIHTALKIGCYGAVEVFGVLVPAKNTKSLNTVEMEGFLQWVRSWASTRGIYIPLPNECGYDY